MNAKEYLQQLTVHLSYLYAFARQINELDFAASLSGEFRGTQDPGWVTTITANEVFEEISSFFGREQALAKAEMRILLMLYCQLAEAGGAYETLKSIMGVFSLKSYLLWPFKDLVRVKKSLSRVIGPNANATFRDLATTARGIGFVRLSELLELAFRDDVRNGVSHADYVIWSDGLRLPMRNGGYGARLSFPELDDAVSRGVGFFQVLHQYNTMSVQSFEPAKEIVGRFSGNPPMPWTVAFDSNTGSFGFSSSAAGSLVTPEYQRQLEINGRLGGKALALYSSEGGASEEIEAHILSAGFEPNTVILDSPGLTALTEDAERLRLWDLRRPQNVRSDALLLSPWGFRYLRSALDFDFILETPRLDLVVE